MGLIFSLFDVVSAQEVPFGIPQCILQGLTSVLLCVPFIFGNSEKHWVVAPDGFLCVTEIVHIFRSGYLDYRDAFQAVLGSHCCIMS